MKIESTLQQRARELLRSGKIPRRHPDRIWGGAAFGGRPCMLCAQPIEEHRVALEVEFTTEGELGTTAAHFHTPCFLAVEAEILQIERLTETLAASGRLHPPAPHPGGMDSGERPFGTGPDSGAQA